VLNQLISSPLQFFFPVRAKQEEAIASNADAAVL